MKQIKRQAQPKIHRTANKRPFAEHLHELRKRVLIVVAVIMVASTGAYFVQQHLVKWLIAPSHNQQFIYTSPGGGIGFLFQLSMYVGLAVSIPVAFYQLVSFLAPVMTESTRRMLLRYAAWSCLLATAGIFGGYYFGLPAALHFLNHQFTTPQIHPLFTLQEYMSFVFVYLLGSAIMFQLPLVILTINRIHPLKPSTLIKGERYVIVAAFVISMLMVPTVNIINQLVIAVPIIVMYQVGIGLVWLSKKGTKQDWLLQLLEQDRMIQAEREKRATELIPLFSAE